MKYVVFDFDGTLADSYKTFLKIFNEMKEAEGRNINFEEIRDIGSMGMIRKSGVPLWRIPGIIREFLRKFSAVENIGMFPGMSEVIKKLGKKYSLGIISTNSEESIRKILRKNNIENMFDFVYSCNLLLGKHRVLNKICKDNGLKKSDIIYIGDEDRDIVAAKKAKVRSIAVTWGFNSDKRLRKKNPDYLASTPKDILNFVFDSFEK